MIAISNSGARVCYIAAAAIVLAGCAAQHSDFSPPGCNISVGGSVLKVASEKGLAYRDLVLLACQGEPKALTQLLMFSDETDGEAMLDHGNVLLDLKTRLGSARFNNALRSLGPERQKAIGALVQTAERTHQSTHQLLGSADHHLER